MILGLLNLWMNSRVPPMDVDPPHPSHIKHIMIYSLMCVIGMIKLKRPNTGRRKNAYNSIVEPTYVDYPQDASDFVQESSYGGIDLSSDKFYQIHALSSRHPPPSRPGSHSKPTLRTQSQNSGPQKSFKRYEGHIYLPPQIFTLLSQDSMKALKAYNTEAFN